MRLLKTQILTLLIVIASCHLAYAEFSVSPLLRIADTAQVYRWTPEGDTLVIKKRGGSLWGISISDRKIRASGSWPSFIPSVKFEILGNTLYGRVLWNRDARNDLQGIWLAKTDTILCLLRIDATMAYISPDSISILCSTGDISDVELGVFLINLKERNVRKVSDKSAEISWSPDGEAFAFYQRDSIFICKKKDSLLTKKFIAEGWLVSPFSWSPNGKYIAYIQEEDVYIVEVKPAVRSPKRLTKATEVLPPECGLYVDKWSPNSRFLTLASPVGTYDFRLFIIEVSTRKMVEVGKFRTPIAPFVIPGSLWSPDSRKLAISTTIPEEGVFIVDISY